MLYFVSVCLRGGQQEIQKDPLAPANKKLLHPKFATLTNKLGMMVNVFHFIQGITRKESSEREFIDDKLELEASQDIDTKRL